MDAIEEVAKEIDYGKPVKRKKKQRNMHNPTSYTQQEVNLQKTPFLFFPPGKEMLFLGIYFVTLPYITGLIFLFFFVSEGKASVFGFIGDDASFFLVWTIGYEILAAIILLLITKNAIMFTIRNNQAQKRGRPKKFNRP